MAPGGLILLVDDDVELRSAVSRLLTRAGFATVEASSGEEALEFAGAEAPAVALLEVCLPDVSGFEVCRQLRDRFGQQLPVMFVSAARADPLDRAVGILLGGDDYLAKPLHLDELLARVRRLMHRAGDAEQRPGGAAATGFDLTKREVEVLRRLAKGCRPAEIARELVISPKTVANHIQHVLVKLGVHTQAQAVALAYEHGLLEVSTD